MAEASKRIDLAAPLLSVRRHGGFGGTLRYGERCDDATPGGVPFGWERRPGHPKGACTTQSAPPLPGPDQEAGVRFSDALSRPDSCYTVSCSDAPGATASASASASAAPSPRGSVMMDRFLLAAKEQCVFRKAAAAAAKTRASHRLPERLPVQHLPAGHVHVQRNHVKDADGNGEDDEWEVHSTAGFASKRKCGLLPTRCAKSALLLLNPARSTMRRRRRGARRFLSGCGSSRRETNPLQPRVGQRPDHDAGTVTRSSWEEVYISSLRRSDRGAVRPKATHLGLLLVLDRADGSAASPLPPPNPKCGRPPTAKANVGGKTPRRLNAVGQGFPPPLPTSQERTVARRDDKMVLALPSPKTPSESWLSRTLPTVSSNRLPATSFMGLHVQQLRNQRAPSRWCSSDQAKVVDHGARARPRQIRIYDLHK